MRILLMADTHMEKWNPPAVMEDLMDDADLIVHAGDFTSPEVYEKLSEWDLKAVYGNSDDPELREKLPEELIFESENVKIGVVHEGQLSINDFTGLGYLAREMGVDVLVFGHAHRFVMERLPSALIVCPGSPTRPRMSFPTCARLDIEEEKAKVREIIVSPKACKSILFR